MAFAVRSASDGRQRDALDEGRGSEVIVVLPGHAATCEEVRKSAEYFSTWLDRQIGR